MKALFSRLVTRFDGLAQRERRLVAAALLGGVALLGWSVCLDPALARLKLAERSVTEQRAVLERLQIQTVVLQSPNQTPEALARAELAALKKQLSEMSQRISVMERALVPPQRMSGLLESMLAGRGGLHLLSLRTLPVVPVLENAASDATTPPAGGLFKHGMEIRLEGSYAELAAYLSRLEKAPQKLLWNSVSLVAENHPRLVLTLTVFTLSLDRTWLIV